MTEKLVQNVPLYLHSCYSIDIFSYFLFSIFYFFANVKAEWVDCFAPFLFRVRNDRGKLSSFEAGKKNDPLQNVKTQT